MLAVDGTQQANSIGQQRSFQSMQAEGYGSVPEQQPQQQQSASMDELTHPSTVWMEWAMSVGGQQHGPSCPGPVLAPSDLRPYPLTSFPLVGLCRTGGAPSSVVLHT